MNGPNPGIARTPIPASRPRVPPIAPPVVTPAVVPSGAFVFFLVSEIPGTLIVGEQYGDIVIGEARREEAVHAVLCLHSVVVNPKYCRLFACHDSVLFSKY